MLKKRNVCVKSVLMIKILLISQSIINAMMADVFKVCEARDRCREITNELELKSPIAPVPIQLHVSVAEIKDAISHLRHVAPQVIDSAIQDDESKSMSPEVAPQIIDSAIQTENSDIIRRNNHKIQVRRWTAKYREIYDKGWKRYESERKARYRRLKKIREEQNNLSP